MNGICALGRLGDSKMNITPSDKYFLFLLNDDVLSLRTDMVKNILSMFEITEFRNLPPFVRGFVRSENTAIPVFDLRIQKDRNTPKSKIGPLVFVVQLDETSIGLVVDRILEIVTIRDEDMSTYHLMMDNSPADPVESRDTKVVTNARSLLMTMEKILKSSNLTKILAGMGSVQ